MLSKATLVAWAAHLVLCGAVAAAEADFFLEGVADPALERARPGAATADALEQRVCQQAYTDAVYHVSAYARGIPFRFDFSAPAQPKHDFGKMEYQSLGMLLPKSKAYRLLNSGLAVGRITYAARDVPQLKLRDGLRELPVYPVLGEYHNPQMELPRAAMHWMAVKDCYRTAVMVHLARNYGNQPVLKVSGRVYPVEFTQSELIPVAAPEAPADESPTGEAPPADDAPAPEPGAGAGGSNAGEDAAPAEPRVRRSRDYVYRLQMVVRVQIDVDGIEFAEQPAPESVPETTPPQPDATPAEPEKAAPAPEEPEPTSDGAGTSPGS